MADIISYDRILRSEKAKKAAQSHQRKVATVRKIFRSAYRMLRCERCGESVKEGHRKEITDHRGHRVPYRFCEICADEYLDYIARLQGRGDPACYWHNEAWSKLWQQWIDFQAAADHYLKSKEFRKLMEEVQKG